jgi:hypothetical protein
MDKDLDSARAALRGAMAGLTVEEQAKLVSEWLAEAFAWSNTKEGVLFWARTAIALNHLRFETNTPFPEEPAE